MVELNTAFAFIHSELKSGHSSSRGRAAAGAGQRADVRAQRGWEQTYRGVDEELEEMRRAARRARGGAAQNAQRSVGDGRPHRLGEAHLGRLLAPLYRRRRPHAAVRCPSRHRQRAGRSEPHQRVDPPQLRARFPVFPGAEEPQVRQ
jgi:hypothetical protein